MWKIGPARTRSAEYEAEILATDMGGLTPILARYKHKSWATWASDHFRKDGRFSLSQEHEFDLLPPLMTPEEVARECASAYNNSPHAKTHVEAMRAALDHYDQLIKDGCVACPCGRGE